MIYGWDASTKVVRFFTTADRVKVRHAAWPSARMIAAILRWPHAGQSDAYLAAKCLGRVDAGCWPRSLTGSSLARGPWASTKMG